MNSPIDKAEIERFRSPDDLLRWFDLVLSHINHDADATKVLLHQGIYKEIHEEIFPLATLVKTKIEEWKNSKFRNVIGPQQYDVEVQSTDFLLEYFEIASTTFDDGEKYRMDELIDRGAVSETASLIRAGKEMKSGNRQVTGISSLARNHDHAIQEVVSKIRERIYQKSKKEYPEKTGLIVYYDDCSHYFRDNDYDQIRSVCEETETVWSKNFDALFAVGITNSQSIELWKQNHRVDPT